MNAGDFYCVGFKDKHGKHAFDKGIHCLSLKYSDCSGDDLRPARCFVGVVSMKICEKCNAAYYAYDGWPYSNNLAMSGYRSYNWNHTEILTIKLDMDARVLTFC